MSTIDEKIKEYLEITGGLKKVKTGGQLGGTAEKILVTPDQKRSFILIVEAEYANTKKIIWLILFMYVIVFSVMIALIIRNLDNPDIINWIMGGSFFSTTGIIYALQKFWHSKSKMDFIISVVPGLPPEETVKILQMLFYGVK